MTTPLSYGGPAEIVAQARAEHINGTDRKQVIWLTLKQREYNRTVREGESAGDPFSLVK
jgi:hypothetical protein